MGIGDKVEQFKTNVQEGVKSSSVSFANLTLRVLSGFFIGLTLALIGQEMMGYGQLAFIFVIFVSLGVTYKATSGWSLMKVFILDLFLILIAMLLRMYILVAP